MAVAFSNAGAHVGDGRINFIFAVITANVETVDATAGPLLLFKLSRGQRAGRKRRDTIKYQK